MVGLGAAIQVCKVVCMLMLHPWVSHVALPSCRSWAAAASRGVARVQHRPSLVPCRVCTIGNGSVRVCHVCNIPTTRRCRVLWTSTIWYYAPGVEYGSYSLIL